MSGVEDSDLYVKEGFTGRELFGIYRGVAVHGLP